LNKHFSRKIIAKVKRENLSSCINQRISLHPSSKMSSCLPTRAFSRIIIIIIVFRNRFLLLLLYFTSITEWEFEKTLFFSNFIHKSSLAIYHCKWKWKQFSRSISVSFCVGGNFHVFSTFVVSLSSSQYLRCSGKCDLRFVRELNSYHARKVWA
jgi:hypothetical protein